jgi:hypothetical protein
MLGCQPCLKVPEVKLSSDPHAPLNHPIAQPMSRNILGAMCTLEANILTLNNQVD